MDVYVRASLVGAALYVLIADLTGAYEPSAQFSLSEAWRRTLRSWLTTALLIATLGFVLKISEDFSRLWADRKSTRLNSSHSCASRMPSSACQKKTTQAPV